MVLKKKNHGSANSLLLNQWLKASVSQAALVPESWNCTALGDRAQHLTNYAETDSLEQKAPIGWSHKHLCPCAKTQNVQNSWIVEEYELEGGYHWWDEMGIQDISQDWKNCNEYFQW